MLVHHRLEAVVGRRRGQRGVVGRGDGAVHGRLVCLVGETRDQRALQRYDAGHLSVRGGQGRRRGQGRNCRRQRAAVQL